MVSVVLNRTVVVLVVVVVVVFLQLNVLVVVVGRMKPTQFLVQQLHRFIPRGLLVVPLAEMLVVATALTAHRLVMVALVAVHQIQVPQATAAMAASVQEAVVVVVGTMTTMVAQVVTVGEPKSRFGCSDEMA
jgi:hypothetical protein